MSEDRVPRVLVVDDEPEIRSLFVKYLDDEYDARAVPSGSDALEAMDEDIDVVLLDRRMPGMSGDEVLDSLRDRGYNCRVAMVTAVSPDLDIIEMGFDDYVIKPVTKSELKSVIDSLLRWDEYDAVLREYFKVARKAAVLEEKNPQKKLEASDRYQELIDRLVELQSNADNILENFDAGEFDSMMSFTQDDPSADEQTTSVRYSS